MVLLLLLVGAHFEKVAEFQTKNTTGAYPWFDDRYVQLEPMTPAAGHCPAMALDVETQKTQPIDFALSEWVDKNAARFYGGKPTFINDWNGQTLNAVSCWELVAYDGRSGTSFHVISNSNGKLGDDMLERLFLVEMPSGRVHAMGEMTYRTVGVFDGRWYLEIGDALQVIELGTFKTRTVAKIEGARSGSWYPSPDRSQIAFIEYSEKSALLDPPARIVVIDIASGSQWSAPAPVSAYGVAWTKTALYIGSNEAGTIQRIDFATKTGKEIAKGHRGIQYFRVTPNEKTLLVITRASSVARYSLAPWKKLAPLSVGAILPGKKIYAWDWHTLSPDGAKMMLPKTSMKETVDFLDADAPGVTLFKFND